MHGRYALRVIGLDTITRILSRLTLAGDHPSGVLSDPTSAGPPSDLPTADGSTTYAHAGSDA